MRQGRGTRWAVAALVAAALLITGGAQARGDACSECGPPTLEDLQDQPGFAIEERAGIPDKVHLHAGECRIHMAAPPRIEKQLAWLELRASGAVWKCPSSTGSDTMTATSAASDSKEWSFSVSSSASASFLGVGLSAEVVATVQAASNVEAVTSISKEMTANYCRIIKWDGFFEVAEYTADLIFLVERRFAWWTKHVLTGSTVHRSGEMWLSCGAHLATLDMRAPIAGYFRLTQWGCPEPECQHIKPQELGWYPPLPPGLKPPVTPEPVPYGPQPEPEDADEPEEEDDDVPDSDELGDPPTGPLPDPFASDEESDK